MSRNPDRKRFPDQDASLTPLARWFAPKIAFAPPLLFEMFVFAWAYARTPGAIVGKTAEQRQRAGRAIIDVELKRVPYRPETMGDNFDGEVPGLLERHVVEALTFLEPKRVRVRSFDHRALLAIKQIDPQIPTAILIAGTAPVDPAGLTKSAGADTYCPDYQFLDERQVQACHAAGVRVIPWTVNEKADWLRLLEWGVDGITTDYPDRLARLLRRKKIEFSRGAATPLTPLRCVRGSDVCHAAWKQHAQKIAPQRRLPCDRQTSCGTGGQKEDADSSRSAGLLGPPRQTPPAVAARRK